MASRLDYSDHYMRYEMLIYILLYSGFTVLTTLLLRLLKPKSDLKIILTATAIILLCFILTSFYLMSETFQAMTVFGAGDAESMASGISKSVDHSMIAFFLIPLSIGITFTLHKLTNKRPDA